MVMCINTISFILLIVCAQESLTKPCSEKNCDKDNDVEDFFNLRMPVKDVESDISSNAIRKLIKSTITNLWSPTKDDEMEGRQYYDSGYDNYGATAYPNYGSYPPTQQNIQSSFNGLDVALSALAFLSFGVWLFNLILPQLTGSGTSSLGGIIKRSTSNNLIDDLFNQGNPLSILNKMTQNNKKSFSDEIMMFGVENLLNRLEKLVINKEFISSNIENNTLSNGRNWMMNLFHLPLGIEMHGSQSTSINKTKQNNEKYNKEIIPNKITQIKSDLNLKKKKIDIMKNKLINKMSPSLPDTKPTDKTDQFYLPQTRLSILDYALNYFSNFVIGDTNKNPLKNETDTNNIFYKFPKSRSRSWTGNG